MFSNLRYVLLSLVCFVLLLAAATFVLGSSAIIESEFDPGTSGTFLPRPSVSN